MILDSNCDCGQISRRNWRWRHGRRTPIGGFGYSNPHREHGHQRIPRFFAALQTQHRIQDNRRHSRARQATLGGRIPSQSGINKSHWASKG